jgi:hypothetical protein
MSYCFNNNNNNNNFVNEKTYNIINNMDINNNSNINNSFINNSNSNNSFFNNTNNSFNNNNNNSNSNNSFFNNTNNSFCNNANNNNGYINSYRNNNCNNFSNNNYNQCNNNFLNQKSSANIDISNYLSDLVKKINICNQCIDKGKNFVINNNNQLLSGINEIKKDKQKCYCLIMVFQQDNNMEIINILNKIIKDIDQTCVRYECLFNDQMVPNFQSE